MATRLLFALLGLLSLERVVLAVFINPPPVGSKINNPIYKLGQEIKIRWNTNAEFTDLTMWQTDTGKRYNLQCQYFNPVSPGQRRFIDHYTANSKSQEYTWIASYQGIDPADGNSFSFWLFETGQTGSLFSSHTFNITDPTSATQSATQPTKAKHPQTKTTSATTETTSEATSSSTIVDEPTSSGLSLGAIAGVAVGSVVVFLSIAGAAFMLWRRKNMKNASESTESIRAAKPGAVEAPNDNKADPGPWEMEDASTQAHELPVADHNYNHRTERWA
ncbi:hypothetical protein FLAG1_11489 [Fusarium langsethiae]|uniref:Uncharacterized protein n=1 Tax=Fusarium langsethiae TaxID=179993 RepID=A0A0M9EM05_FUSLA|nr:hypothetical protein FLAG1_11489 [Fusarium langsethiae]GKU08856.1 unnamed protein product [Fusarium langsethiae]GKU10147.1 unnamed protein product [Fusarium langsethiae]